MSTAFLTPGPPPTTAPYKVGRPKKHELRAEAERDQDVGAAPHPAVEHDREPVADRSLDGRQGVERGRRLVELTAAMV
jgi:hypothetical protein